MKQKKLLALVGSICLILVLALLPFMGACAKPAPAPAPAPEEEVIELSLAHFGPTVHSIHTKGFVPWSEMVEEATNGRIKITIYPAEALCKAGDTYDAVRTGVADIGASHSGYTPGRFPLTEVMSLPFLGLTSPMVGSKVMWELINEFPEFQAEYGDVKLLFVYCNPLAQLHTVKKPVHTLEDLKGMLIRTPGTIAPLYEALGATAVPMPYADLYPALEKGVVDGTSFPWEGMEILKLADVTFYHTEINHYLGPYYIVMNLDKWNRLPPDLQKALESVSGEQGGTLLSEAYDTETLPGKEYCRKLGHEVYTLPPEEMSRWAEASKPIWDEWLARVEAKGLPGQRMLDRLIELAQKYSE